MAVRYPAIPHPTADPAALQKSVLALKEIAETLTQQRGDRSLSAVTWQDLVNLGLILPSQVPITPRST
jgi:hypothetical protein